MNTVAFTAPDALVRWFALAKSSSAWKTLHPYAAPANHLLHRHRKPIAVSTSILLHLLLLLALIPHALEGMAGGAGGSANDGDGKGLAVELVSADELKQADLTAKTTNADDNKALDVAQALDSQAETPSLQTADAELPTLSQDTPSLPAPSAPAQTSQAAGGAGSGGQLAGTGDDLWAAIAPCWKRLAGSDALPVTLTVSFAGNGLLATSPDVVRDPGTAVDVQVQRSEGEAIQAVSECGAYAMAANRENVVIKFPKP